MVQWVEVGEVGEGGVEVQDSVVVGRHRLYGPELDGQSCGGSTVPKQPPLSQPPPLQCCK